MAEQTLSNPTIEVNDVIIAIIPNSCSFKSGTGDKKVKPQSSGGDAISVVITEDAETKMSMVKFKLYNTTTNLQVKKDWSVLNGSTIGLSEGDFSESFTDMVIITEPEIAVGADGELEVEWNGAPSL